MKTADWQHFLQYCEPYVFHGILPGDYATTLAMLTGVFRKILDLKCTTRQSDDDAKAVTRALELECATALSAYEQVWPSVLMSGPVIHTLIHYPTFIYRWNSVRNYWCYYNERYSLLGIIPCIWV